MCDFSFFFLKVRIFLLDVCATPQFVLIKLSETCHLKLNTCLTASVLLCLKIRVQNIYVNLYDMHASLDIKRQHASQISTVVPLNKYFCTSNQITGGKGKGTHGSLSDVMVTLSCSFSSCAARLKVNLSPI